VKNVGKITVVIRDDLEKKFRETVFKDKGMKQGNISLSIEEALEMWMENKAKEQKERK
jgi:hypothetical protein